MSPISKARPILATLHKINQKYGKMYCYPSQKTLLALLDVRQGLCISIATLNRWLLAAEREGFLIRTRRIRNDPERGIIFKSTLYKITLKGYWALKMLGVSVWREMKAITAQGLKAAAHTLGKFKGPVAMKTILGATGMFGIKQKTFILEK